MKSRLIAFTLIFTGILSIVSCSFLSNGNDSNNWNQFRGIHRNGSSNENIASEKWLSNGPELLWKTKLGSGFSEILISKDYVYTMISEKIDSLSGSEYMVAYDALNGREIWKTYLDSMLIDPDGSGEGPRSTPVFDNNSIFCLSSFGKLNALTKNNGEVIWTVDLLKEFGNKPGWIYTSSPMLIENQLIIEIGGAESKGFAAIDKNSGKTLWIKGDGVPSYSSPTIATINGELQTIFANGSHLISFNKKGNELWSYKMPFNAPIASPLFIAPNKLFISSGRGCFMVEVESNIVSEVFNNKSMRNTFSTSCYLDGCIYGISSGFLKCISIASGETKWQQRGFGLGSLSLAGNKILALTDKGVLKMVQANSDSYNEEKSMQVLAGKSWTAPSFANGILYVRNLSEMASYRIYN